ncbi:MAG: RluA family pseudouridine synthase [Mangrovibacterium sp.]
MISQFHPLPQNLIQQLPPKFPYLFNHVPHSLCKIAACELQNFLSEQTQWNKLLGTHGEDNAVGKMFGVLVVINQQGDLGYLAGFSGAIGNCNHHPNFVPPIYNLLNPNNFFKQGEKELNSINESISSIEQSNTLKLLRNELFEAEEKFKNEQQKWNSFLKKNKEQRASERALAHENLAGEELTNEIERLNKQSQLEKIEQKRHINLLKDAIDNAKLKLEQISSEIDSLKKQRKIKSAELQQQIFKQFQLINCRHETKDVMQIFLESGLDTPPAGTGDCAAPKLLQFAFMNQLKPIALAEFWWGASPKSEIRKHASFYPPCQNKCAPILKHMLLHVEQEQNPLLDILAAEKPLQIIYEDQWMLVVNKPEGCLSVPGKIHTNSILNQLKKQFPEASGPLLVHRLDMPTSGVLIAAKDPETHKELQNQFIKRSTQKCYLAILDGNIEENSGVIDLPLRTDFNNRPQQLVCHEHGKAARTIWKVLERKNGKTRVLFFPITGRTHQLRVHAAHLDGLNMPIVGDELYGKSANRLYLHALWIKITHPKTGKEMTFAAPEPF